MRADVESDNDGKAFFARAEVHRAMMLFMKSLDAPAVWHDPF